MHVSIYILLCPSTGPACHSAAVECQWSVGASNNSTISDEGRDFGTITTGGELPQDCTVVDERVNLVHLILRSSHHAVELVTVHDPSTHARPSIALASFQPAVE
jgi:hypothetical protein